MVNWIKDYWTTRSRSQSEVKSWEIIPHRYELPRLKVKTFDEMVVAVRGLRIENGQLPKVLVHTSEGYILPATLDLDGPDSLAYWTKYASL